MVLPDSTASPRTSLSFSHDNRFSAVSAMVVSTPNVSCSAWLVISKLEEESLAGETFSLSNS